MKLMGAASKPLFGMTKKRAAAFGFAFAFLLASGAARADGTDPFQFDTTQWKSFERYKEESASGATPPEAAAPAPSAAATVDSVLVPSIAPSAQTVAAAPALAAPMRPLDPPVMPGISKDLSAGAGDDNLKNSEARVTGLDGQPAIVLPEHNWQNAAAASKRRNSSDADMTPQPLDVRMSFLPNEQMTPIPAPEYEGTHGRAPTAPAATPAIAAAAPKPASDVAACAAVDTYKKRQLEAIESDRKTLTALQAAIAQLGLQKQLGFMSGAGTSASTEADNASIKMDMPAAAAAPGTGKNQD